jgi:hypothetical protein
LYSSASGALSGANASATRRACPGRSAASCLAQPEALTAAANPAKKSTDQTPNRAVIEKPIVGPSAGVLQAEMRKNGGKRCDKLRQRADRFRGTLSIPTALPVDKWLPKESV